MSYLARKISRAKWEPKEGLEPNEISADAVTADLRTQSNNLSFWKIGNPTNDDELCTVALALATGANRIDPVDLTWVETNNFSANGVEINKTDGRTPVKSLIKSHVDVIKLDMKRLCSVAVLVDDALGKNQHRRFTKTEIVKIIIKAINQNLVSKSDLQPKVIEEIEKKLTSPSKPKK